VVLLLSALTSVTQTMPAAEREILDNRELVASFGQLIEELQSSVKLPAPRTQSHILPLLAPDTIGFAAIPNYGDAAQQALQIFRQQLKNDAVLRDWWGKGDLASAGPKIEDWVERFSQLNQYLGDEIVVSASTNGKEPTFLVASEVRRPGLKKFLADL